MKSKQEQKNIVGLYLRLSHDDERAGESLSIENQRVILHRYAEENRFRIYDEYIDDGISGTTFNRPGVQRLLDDAKAGIIDTIVVKDLSRFGRNYIEVGQYLDYVFPAFGIRFIAIQDNVDTANRESGGMEMMPIMNVFNEWHAANTSKKIRAVLKANAKEGKYHARKAPYKNDECSKIYAIKKGENKVLKTYNNFDSWFAYYFDSLYKEYDEEGQKTHPNKRYKEIPSLYHETLKFF